MNKRTIAHVGGAYKRRIAETLRKLFVTQRHQGINSSGVVRLCSRRPDHHRQDRPSSCGPNLTLADVDRSADKPRSS
jgi:hypothetical protein